MPTTLPSSAVCRDCRYALRNLETNVCPECGRAFDPEDAKTYIDDLRLNRRRRIVRWCVVLFLLGTLAFVFWPRSIRRGTIQYNFADGSSMTIRRWEPVPASWLPIRYPGISWKSGAPVHAPFQVTVDFTTASGSLSGGTNAVSTKLNLSVEINGEIVTPDNGLHILKQLAAQNVRGISVVSKPPDAASKARMDEYLDKRYPENPDETDN